VIPKIIHRVWVGGREPEWQASFRESWEQPGWELWQWGDEDIEGLLLRNRPLYDKAEKIAGRFAGQFRADLIRYEILEQHGGVYVDADFECLRPLDELEAMVGDADCFAAWEEPNVWINNAIFGAVPGHRFVNALISLLPQSVVEHAGARPNIMVGPQFVTRVYRMGYEDDVLVLPKETFYPYLWNELGREREDFPNAFAVHHWGNRRRERWQKMPRPRPTL